MLNYFILWYLPFTDVYSKACNFDVQGSGEFISSDSLENCRTSTWVITAPLNHNIKLKFASFLLSDSPEYGQNLIEIYDGRYTNTTLLGAFTGTTKRLVIQSSGRFMLVKLIKKDKLYALCNFKGVFTFGTTKGKFVISYLMYVNGSELTFKNLLLFHRNVIEHLNQLLKLKLERVLTI